jgi:type VI secretion system protein ImpA
MFGGNSLMKHIIDVEELLQDISPENPCGEDLEYDADFVAMDQASQGKEEQRVGDSIVAAEDPEWRVVRSRAIDLIKRSKDLRTAIYLTRSLTALDGLVGLHDGLALVDGLIERHWDNFHPVLDPDDNFDPMIRVNTLMNLSGQETMVRPIHKMELASAKGMGRVLFADVLVAEGKIPPPEDQEVHVLTMAEIEATFMDCELEPLQDSAEAAREAMNLVAKIEASLMEKVGATQTIGFAPITEILKEIDALLSAQLVRRGVGVPDAEGDGAEGGAKQESGEINTREDVVRVLDRACDYYRRNEPSSPVPLLLIRAKRLVTKEFVDIMRDLAPTGLAEIEKLKGPDGD